MREYLSRFINININVRNARMTYIVKRIEYCINASFKLRATIATDARRYARPPIMRFGGISIIVHNYC